ncbi:NAD-dependent epimerase/dehydratase family protein [Streptantibioticus rubrisoli]|uniref:NAD-dependent epimerase/dehydratase family protein n=1 Tax=Streptantibioticus rubrisoli TaxID=1387313 RepID=A0ABT1P7B6_9ACTN|nr:NAD-dependent epimerase/dehydratase family protein [Streptantibioticus rubrisoli]MCQ4041272.1 NAD-dependent epimerase/dehydratase family protein [Streptantibioticus rubrisoli]
MRVLITGASGFIGRRVVGAVAAESVHLRLLRHNSGLQDTPRDAQLARADLTNPASLRGLCDGVDVLVHCASHIGDAPELCEAVNTEGTKALVAEAHGAGVRRIVYLSTAAVYGEGPFTNVREGQFAPRPVSVTSSTRLAAEKVVLAHGGTVLRPHLVYGAGDRWVIPATVWTASTVKATVDGGRALLSLIDVDDLARAIAACALSPRPRPGVYHAAHPQPVPLKELLDVVTSRLGLPRIEEDLPYDLALERFTAHGGRKRHLDMMARDHWFDSTRLWSDFDCVPGEGFRAQFARHADWYRDHLRL